MKRAIALMLSLTMVLGTSFLPAFADESADTRNHEVFKLGNEVLFEKYHELIDGKRIGLITNQSGVNSKGVSTIEVLAGYKSTNLVALYGPEHGIDGKARAGQYVKSYTHPTLKIPVYSLYGETRMPTAEMLRNIDVLLFDIQDIGARSYTYISTLNYAMKAAQKYHKQMIVLDRPNPVGGEIVDGMMLEDGFQSFVGVDILPMAHGMTVGELALYFNRNIGADLIVIPMEGYTRDMVWQDTGLKWIPTSPMIPDIDSVFGYMATGMGEGTGIFQADKFKWIGGKGIDSAKYAALLNQANLGGITFIPENRGSAGGVRLKIEDYHTFNPAKTGIYALAYARILNQFKVPKSGKTTVMFDKILGNSKFGQYLEQNLAPQQIEELYSNDLEIFKEQRKAYLIYPSSKDLAELHSDESPKDENRNTGLSDGNAGMVDAGNDPKTEEKVVYLTFDDGPSVQTAKILDILKKENVPATFFVIGSHIKGKEEILQRMVKEGHVIGSHTYSHDYSTLYKNIDAFFQDLEKGNRLIEEATGTKVELIRFPGGSNNEVSKRVQDPKRYNQDQWIMTDLIRETTKRGYRYFDWNVSIGDSSFGLAKTEDMMKRVKDGIKDKREAVLLLHDAPHKESTVQALPEIIAYLKSQGYFFKVLDRDSPHVELGSNSN